MKKTDYLLLSSIIFTGLTFGSIYRLIVEGFSNITVTILLTCLFLSIVFITRNIIEYKKDHQ